MLPRATARARHDGRTATLLVELLTEELPPKALKRLGEAFAEAIADGPARARIPRRRQRRHAVRDAAPAGGGDHATCAPSRRTSRSSEKLMPVSVAFDAARQADRRRCVGEAQGRRQLAPCSMPSRRSLTRVRRQGRGAVPTPMSPRAVPLATALQAALDEAIAALPIPKVMSYQRRRRLRRRASSSGRRTGCSRCTAPTSSPVDGARTRCRPHDRRPSLPRRAPTSRSRTPTPTRRRCAPKAR